jgi:hypothetical protein
MNPHAVADFGKHRRSSMFDVMMIAIGVASFVVLLGYVSLCERM